VGAYGGCDSGRIEGGWGGAGRKGQVGGRGEGGGGGQEKRWKVGGGGVVLAVGVARKGCPFLVAKKSYSNGSRGTRVIKEGRSS